MLDIDLRRRFGGFSLDARFQVAENGVTALFGQSGSGKTSIINMIAGLVRPDSGRVAVNGATLFDSARRIDVPVHRRRVGYVFQEARLLPHLSVRGNLQYGMKRVPAAKRYLGFDRVVGLLGIDHLLDRRPARLSGGERQRVAIGRALLASPRLLLMDEPLASLDAARKAEILPFIERLQREAAIPVIYVSHSMDEVMQIADMMVVLDAGRAVAVGGVEEIAGRLDLAPITGRYEAGSVIAATVADHDQRFHLTRLVFPGGALQVPQLALPPGTGMRVRIRARDISLALSRPTGISVLNILEGSVARIEDRGDGEASVGVALGGGLVLWTSVTARAVHDLGLAPGRPIFALVKSVAIDRRNLARHDAPAKPQSVASRVVSSSS